MSVGNGYSAPRRCEVRDLRSRIPEGSWETWNTRCSIALLTSVLRNVRVGRENFWVMLFGAAKGGRAHG
jgi:hypothetical protein